MESFWLGLSMFLLGLITGFVLIAASEVYADNKKKAGRS